MYTCDEHQDPFSAGGNTKDIFPQNLCNPSSYMIAIVIQGVCISGYNAIMQNSISVVFFIAEKDII